MLNSDRTESAVLITCSPAFEASALQELRASLPSAPVNWIAEGIALAVLPGDFDLFALQIQRQCPVFIRHIAPAQRAVALSGTVADIEILSDAARALADRLNPAQTFSVQSRVLGEGPLPYRKFDINHTLSDILAVQTGADVHAATPQQIVSVLCTADTGYLGVSTPEQNRSDWPGGEHRFRREEAQISRAEFKLLEAIDVFGLALPEKGWALDMGASPGGWTRVLRARGLNVVAVDPGDLDVKFKKDHGVTHLRKRIEEFLPCKRKFDVVVNDMRMDALDSVENMLQARSCLASEGIAVMTLKLPEAPGSPDALSLVRLALDRLTRSYRILEARQLFHNRSEVTVALR